MNTETIITTISSKGQVTIPVKIRKLLHITSAGDLVGFVPSKNGVFIKHLEIKEEDFTQEEWDKLEKLANKRGKTYKDARAFLKELKNL
jgi:AbrB family looped-hinge helix DNA binding protein